jgi:excinuclease UvrABC nuclease subunit
MAFTLYKIYYKNNKNEDILVYVGRTKRRLQDRIRGHVFSKPMHRTIDIDQISKIEYCETQTEADMNLYEIYYILAEKPPLNIDDKTKDYPTISLPPLTFKQFTTPLFEKWKNKIHENEKDYQHKTKTLKTLQEQKRIIRNMYHMGTISEFEMEDRLIDIETKIDLLQNEIHKKFY